MLKEIEKELIRYFKILDEHNTDVIIGGLYDGSVIHAGESYKFNIQLMYSSEYDVPANSYKSSEIKNFGLITGSIKYGNSSDEKTLIELEFLLDLDDEKIVRIETALGIIPRAPSFKEFMRYLTFCLGLKRKDFQSILDQIKLLCVSAV